MSVIHSNSKDSSKFTGLNVIIIAIVSLFFLKNSILAQDIHFSQILSTPVFTNPANTGTADDGLRIATDYRNQWASMNVPFNTFYTSIDKKLLIRNQTFGLGAFVIHDQSSGNRLSADKIHFSLSYSRFYKNNQFVIGVQPGFVNRYFNPDGITFGSQFNPSAQRFDPNLPSQETNFIDNIYYFDLNIGILWRAHIKTLVPVAGFSICHITRPYEEFINSKQVSRLPLKYILHSQVQVPINSKFDITPCFLFGYTPGTREFVAGGIGGYTPGNFFVPVKKLYAINLYRINPARNIDAIIIGGGVKFSMIDVCISYDINVSSLRRATNFRGAFEISLIYTGIGGMSKPAVEPCNIF